jgi:PHS family inorganic phosphate transporter-like MFS transporter
MVALIVVAAHKTALPSDLQLTGNIQLAAIDRMWRILIGLGCVPAAVGLYFRLTIPETPRFTMDIELNLQKAFDDIDKVLTPHHFERTENGMIGRVELPRASIRDLVKYFSEWPNLKVMIGTCWSWFALDVRELCTEISQAD